LLIAKSASGTASQQWKILEAAKPETFQIFGFIVRPNYKDSVGLGAAVYEANSVPVGDRLEV
jgi:hypothetical protein